jgi:hypothetical protein
MRLDLHHRPTLVKSWLATLHGPQVTVRPILEGPLPGWAPLVRTAVAWHVAYALVAYAGALFVARSGSSNPIATAIQHGGIAAVLVTALAVWWGGVALSTGLWWTGIRRARAQR